VSYQHNLASYALSIRTSNDLDTNQVFVLYWIILYRIVNNFVLSLAKFQLQSITSTRLIINSHSSQDNNSLNFQIDMLMMVLNHDLKVVLQEEKYNNELKKIEDMPAQIAEINKLQTAYIEELNSIKNDINENNSPLEIINYQIEMELHMKLYNIQSQLLTINKIMNESELLISTYEKIQMSAQDSLKKSLTEYPNLFLTGELKELHQKIIEKSTSMQELHKQTKLLYEIQKARIDELNKKTK
jgi:hypothetical protein